ncbi:winged helix DNA-binding domain-containing protein [Fomitiporia mediterranea MF3/22]|uniref:winged helix DNA-binding domain-containing protein n=1 Tax=Fomitiporia mediterranea (strain MF3/22) TaxID=694068 RepID=UPI00044082B4|nr:winged helix DNA-binding domain-containing protein [Fomitiporia mediterranea MF3/22]EJD05608.1 winged helix DNA-binding domain-containing protein [Fomitiporia mediterranea MF3/22]
MPVTTLSFPLDLTSQYLLGQLEYYFSVQNLASDVYLRKQMDSKGWIPIDLIASFNRVRQLTPDRHLVKEVLSISSLVEVRGDHVRLSNHQWANFVLPSAATSTVEDDGIDVYQPTLAEEGEKETEETEEDDVVFILGSEQSRPWTGTN